MKNQTLQSGDPIGDIPRMKNQTTQSGDPNVDIQTIAYLISMLEWPCVGIAAIAILSDLLAIYVMSRTRRIPINIKRLCITILALEIPFLITHFVHVFHNILSEQVRTVVRVIRYACIETTWRQTAVLAFERLLAVKWPWLYNKIAKTFVVCAIVGNILLCILTITIMSLYFRELDTPYVHRIISVWELVCMIVIIVSYVNIGLHIRQKTEQTPTIFKNKDGTISQRRRPLMLHSTKILIILTVCFVVSNLPGIIVSLLCNCETYAYILPTLNCLVSPILYIWRFSECQLVFLKCLQKAFTSKRLDTTVAIMHVKVYDIPTAINPLSAR